ncbi:hypothetical protein HPB50_008567 [Hyalomma asiaticum]|uniref:Uncharacterized protein n=1 Tax=Hyalomma asiaticum TaxID=266040 RepID=A0ACB7RV46_HYAAI|nr:hypothetical protein HPB50_008567 [Hyalomma asiaticum]
MEDDGGAVPHLHECCTMPFVRHPGIFGEAPEGDRQAGPRCAQTHTGGIGPMGDGVVLFHGERGDATVKIAYENRLRLPKQNIARRMLIHTIFAGRSTRWTRQTAALRRHFELPPPVCLEKAEEAQRTRLGEGVQQRMREKEIDAWWRPSETK